MGTHSYVFEQKHACQVRVTVGDSGPCCCCICVMHFERRLTPLCVDYVFDRFYIALFSDSEQTHCALKVIDFESSGFSAKASLISASAGSRWGNGGGKEKSKPKED